MTRAMCLLHHLQLLPQHRLLGRLGLGLKIAGWIRRRGCRRRRCTTGLATRVLTAFFPDWIPSLIHLYIPMFLRVHLASRHSWDKLIGHVFSTSFGVLLRVPIMGTAFTLLARFFSFSSRASVFCSSAIANPLSF